MRCYGLLLIILVMFLKYNDALIETKQEQEGPLWIYNCIPDEGCQRSEKPLPITVSRSAINSSLAFDSLDVCRTVCGRFGGIWPKPVSAALSIQTVNIHPSNLRFDLSDVKPQVRKMISAMIQVATNNLLAECGGNVTYADDSLVIVNITVKSSSDELSLDTNEEYVLDVHSKSDSVMVYILAETIYGARHALETFTHLVASYQPDLEQCGLKLVAGAKIRDHPAYKYRGFLLDTSRNFIPLSDIKRMIDGMAATKMNVFHWHVTDSHSFPLESKRVPQFTRYGAYSSDEIYSVEEVHELIQYAQVRGVRVMIEIDAPAHAGNGWQWGKEYGLDDLAVCVNAKQWRNLCIQAPCGQLNPANPDMYRVLKDLYSDIADLLLKPSLVHLGGDEVFLSCWNSSEQIVSYMKNRGFNVDSDGFIRLWAEFHAKSLDLWDEVLASLNQPQQRVMLWSSELTKAHRIQKYINKDRYIIEVWEPLSSPLLNQLLQLGYQVVSVPKDIWYLDHGFWGNTRYSNWRKMYAHSLPKETNMLGGEVALWTEFADSNALDTRVWPRAAAVGERLWSNPTSTGQTYSAEPRLQRHRQRLIARGLRPDALTPGWCAHNDARCL